MIAIGHRGAAGCEPENTLRAVRCALALGAEGIEVDVQFVHGELLIFHDSRLQRTTNGRGSLRSKSFAALRLLDAGAGERIPTLREVVDEVGGRAFLNIELKGRGTAAPVARLLSEYLLSGARRPSDFLISSFWRRETRQFRALADPRIAVGLLLRRPPRGWAAEALALRASSVHPSLRFTTPSFVAAAHARGLRVYPYTVNTERSLLRLDRLSIDGVFTDFPDLPKRFGRGADQ